MIAVPAPDSLRSKSHGPTRVPGAPTRGVVLGSVAIAVLAVVAAVGAGGAGAASETIVVDDDGGEYDSIQAAVDAADPGDRIRVEPGTYAEGVRVDVNVTLVAPDGATLDGTNLSATAGIRIPAESHLAPTVAGLTVRDFDAGVVASRTRGDWTARNLTLRSLSFAGVDAAASTGDWTLVGSSVAGVDGNGVYAPRSTGDWTVEDVTISDVGFAGVDAARSTGEWVVRNATIVGTGFAGVDAARSTGGWTVAHTEVLGAESDGVLAADSTGDWTLADVRIRGGAVGVAATGSEGDWSVHDATVVENSIVGVDAAGSTGNWTVREATVRDNGRGVVATGTGGAWDISRTTITGNAGAGIDATGAAVEGDARRNWFGRPAGPTSGQCVGVVDCTAPLTNRPEKAFVVDHRVDRTTLSTGGSTTLTVEVDPGTSRERLSISGRFDPSFGAARIERVTVRGRGSVLAKVASDELFTVAVRDVSANARIVAVVEVTAPANATGETIYTLTGEVEAGSDVAPLPTRRITVTDANPIDRADTNDDGRIDDGELQAAIQQWVEGGYTDGALSRIIDAWVEGG